jgi:hypothetical protein
VGPSSDSSPDKPQAILLMLNIAATELNPITLNINFLSDVDLLQTQPESETHSEVCHCSCVKNRSSAPLNTHYSTREFLMNDLLAAGVCLFVQKTECAPVYIILNMTLGRINPAHATAADKKLRVSGQCAAPSDLLG